MNEKAPASIGRVVWLVVYYTLVIIGIYVLHGQGGFSTPKFIYQGF